MKNYPPLLHVILMIAAYMAMAAKLSAATPVVFNATETALPGDTIYLQGDNFPTTTPSVYFHLMTGGESIATTAPYTPLPPSTTLLPASSILTFSKQAITAILPQNVPMGLYVLWVYDGTNYSPPVFINRARATSFEYDQIASYNAANLASTYTFRIFGRNLNLKGLSAGTPPPTVTFVSGANTFAATIDTTYPNDENVIRVKAPSGLTAGTAYSVKVSNGAGHGSGNYDITTASTIQGAPITILARNAGADPFNLGVPWGSDFVSIAADVVNITTTINPHTNLAYSADPNFSTNAVNAIQQALYDAGNTKYHPNGATVYLPTGTYNISYVGENAQFVGPSIYNPTTQTYPPNTANITQNAPNLTGHWQLEVPPRVVLKGDGIGQTTITDNSPAFNGYVFFLTFADTAPFFGSLSGATGFTYNPAMTVSAGYHPPAIRSFANNSSEMFFDHIAANYTGNAHGTFNTTDTECGEFTPQATLDTDILIQYCNMSFLNVGNANAYSDYYSYGSHYIFRNNTFASWSGRLEFVLMDNLLFDTNTLSRDANFPTLGGDSVHGGGGLEASGSDITVINNILNAINVTPTNQVPANNTGETILCQYTVPLAGGTTNPTESGTIPQASVTTEITSTTLTDTTTVPAKNWATNAYAGLSITLTWGPGNGYSAVTATVASNTNNVITFSAPLSKVPTGNYPVAYTIWQTNPNVPDSGRVSSATVSSITDTTKSWSTTTNGAGPYYGLTLVITGGTAAGEWGTINGNTATKISVTGGWRGAGTIVNPDSTSSYAIQQADSYVMSAVSSSTSTTLTDTSRDSLNTIWPTNYHVGDSVAIVTGSGTGQISKVVSNTADTLTVSPAWVEPPGNGAQYSINGAISNCAHRWLVKNNTLSQVPRGIIIGYGGFDNDIIGNTLQSAGGIFVGSTQRNFLVPAGTKFNIPYNRMDLNWRNLVTDNFVSDPYLERAPYIDMQGSYGEAIFGPLLLGIENRRNILESSETLSPPWDGGFGCDESFGNVLTPASGSGYLQGIGSLASVFGDNLSLNSDIAYEVTSGDSQTVIADSLQQNCGGASGLTTSNNLLLHAGYTLPQGDLDEIYGDFSGKGDAISNQTAVGSTADGVVMDANFTGTGTSTGIGGTAANLVDVGETGALVQALGEKSSVLATPTFDGGSGSYLHISLLANGGAAGAGLQSTAISPRFSWARIFDQRSGEWLVNGGFDFFLRPGENYPNPGGGQYMRAIDIGNPGTNSLRMVFYYSGSNQIMLQVITPTNGGGNNGIAGSVTSILPSGFVAGSTYHLGVTFSTDASKSPPLTTAKIYVAAGTGAIDTVSTANLIATGTFALNHSIVNDSSATSWFNGGSWVFGGGYGPGGIPITNDFDGFRLYYVDPGTLSLDGGFPALDSAP